MVGAGGNRCRRKCGRARPFPFVFGGDGASFAVCAADAPVRQRGRCRPWRSMPRDEFELGLRVARRRCPQYAPPAATSA